MVRSIILLLCATMITSVSSGCAPHSSNSKEINEQQQEYIFTKVNNYQGLLKLYREKLSRNEDPEVRFKLAEYYNLVNDFDSSLHYLAPLLEQSPDDKVFLLQGKNLMAMGKDSLAREAILYALDFNTKNGEAYNILGILQARNGEFNAAYQSFNHARELFVPEEQVMNNLAMLMILQENYEQAYHYLMPLYTRGHTTKSILHNLAFVLVKMKKYEEASNVILTNGLDDHPETLIAELMTTITNVKPAQVANVQNKKVLKNNINNPNSAKKLTLTLVKQQPEKAPAPVAHQAVQVVDAKPAEDKKATAFNTTGSKQAVLTTPEQNTKKHNEISSVRFGTHAGYSRLTLASPQKIDYWQKNDSTNATFQVVLTNIANDDEFKRKISSVYKHIGIQHRDIKSINIEKSQLNSLIMTIAFNRDIKVKIFRLPDSVHERLVFDFL